MENALIQIKNSLIGLLKRFDPGTDVFFDEIKSTDEGHGMNRHRTYYFVEMIPNVNETVDRFMTDIGVLVDVAYHEEHESNTAYLMKAAQLDGIIRPVFSFGDRHITVPETSSKVIDHVLHCCFTISFRQARETTAAFQEMGELEITAKEGG